jgi:putative hemolysin
MTPVHKANGHRANEGLSSREGSEEMLLFPPIYVGNLKLFLATEPQDILAAKQLRYDVFSKEAGAKLPDPSVYPDADPFDDVCDHLIVQDVTTGEIVGTYRLARRAAAERLKGFYTAAEYDLGPLLAYPNLLELSRSCVRRDYRTLPTIQLLWRGLAEYALAYDIDFFFGCGSFPGTDLQAYAHALSYLYYFHLAPASCRPCAHLSHYRDMRLLPREAVDPHRAFCEMPPLIKGYLRVGCFVGDGAFIDLAFNTIDVCIIVKKDLLTKRYAHHYNARSVQKARFHV